MMLIEKIAEASVNATHFQNWDPSTDAAGQFAKGGVVKSRKECPYGSYTVNGKKVCREPRYYGHSLLIRRIVRKPKKMGEPTAPKINGMPSGNGAMGGNSGTGGNGGAGPAMAAGGVTRGPVNAILGEAGPEVVIPLKKKFMNMNVKDVVRHFKRREMQMRKSAAKKKKDRRIKAIGKGKISHGGYDESSGGALVPNTSLGNRQLDSPSSGYGGQMGSLAAGGPPISGSVRAGSQVNLR